MLGNWAIIETKKQVMTLSRTLSIIHLMKKVEIQLGKNRIETPEPDDVKEYHWTIQNGINSLAQINLSSNCHVFRNCKNDKDQTYNK